MKKGMRILAALAAALLTFSGCGAEGTTTNTDTESQDGKKTQNSDEMFPAAERQETNRLRPANYGGLEVLKPENAEYTITPRTLAGQDGFYVLRSFYMDSGYQCFLERYAVPDFEKTTVELPLGDWNLTDETVVGFDLSESGMSFLIEAGETSGEYRIVNTDRSGALQTEIRPEEKLADAEGNPVFRYSDGYYFVVSGNGQECLSFDAEGKTAGTYSCGGEGRSIGAPVKSGSGEVIFPVTDEGTGDTKLITFDGESGTWKERAVLPQETVTLLCGMSGQQLFYIAQEKLNCWNVEDGSRETLFSFANIGISPQTDRLCLLAGENGDVWLYVGTLKKEYVMTFSENVEEAPIQLAMLCDGNSDFKSGVTRFNQVYPQYSVDMQEPGADTDSYRNRIMADIVNGGGPDLLYLSYEDFTALADMGALADLEEFVDASVMDKLLPNVKSLGELDGTLLGIVPGISSGVRTLFTSGQTWDGEGWSLDDILRLTDEKKDLQGLFTYPTRDMDLYNTLYSLIGIDLERSKFIDLESGESRFEENDFAAVLELVKKYSGNGNAGSGGVDGAARVREGSYLAMNYPFNRADFFFRILSDIDGAGHAVGCPVEEGSGNYFSVGGILAVNRNAQEKTAIKAFLEYMLSLENQAEFKNSLSVRKDITDVTVQYNEYVEQYMWEGLGLLPGKADGSTYVEEYKAFMESCLPDKGDTVLFDIIWGEAESYFSDARKAQDVVRAIDNRIQLYLDERK